MPHVLTQNPALVTSSVSYVKLTTDKPFNYMFEPPKGVPWESCEYEQREVQIRDERQSLSAPTLDRAGFELLQSPTTMKNFLDQEEVRRTYYPEMESAALRATGGRSVHVFDHLVRKREEGRPALSFGRKTQKSEAAAVGRVHNDYTERSGQHRLRLVLGDEEASRVTGRYCIVNIWRSISGVIVDTPLAFCDALSVGKNDLVDSDIRYPNRTGEICLVRFNPAHRWSYFHALQPDEVLVFKQYDSSMQGVSRFTPHAAFDHPDTPPDAPLRQSMEVRVLVLY